MNTATSQSSATRDVQGTVHRGSILLEKPLPELEGKKVLLHLEVIGDADAALPLREQREAWDAWVARGPQGPLEDEDSADWP